MGLRHDVLANDELAARVDSVVVLFDYERQEKRVVSDALRATLRRYGTDGLVDVGG